MTVKVLALAQKSAFGYPSARLATHCVALSDSDTLALLEAASVDAGNNINNNHNGQQSQKSQQQAASLSAISSKLNNLAQSNLNNNNTSIQPGSMTSASNHIQNVKQNQNQNQNTDSRRSSSLDPDGDVDDVVDAVHGGAFEDDMQALLPKCSRRSRDELSQVSFPIKYFEK